MRRRLVISTIAIVLVVLGALAVPVGLIVYNAAEQQLSRSSQDQADRHRRLHLAERASPASSPTTKVPPQLVDEDDGIRIIDARWRRSR